MGGIKVIIYADVSFVPSTAAVFYTCVGVGSFGVLIAFDQWSLATISFDVSSHSYGSPALARFLGSLNQSGV